MSLDLRSIFTSNGVGIIILLILLYVSRTKALSRRVEDKVFLFMVLGVLVGCFMEALSYAIDGQLFPGSRLLNYAANTYLYSVNLMLPFCVLIYVDLELYGDPKRIWRCYKPQVFIGVAMLSATLVNLFIPITFYISDANVYERRPLSYFYFVVIFYYCIAALLLTRRYAKENGTKAFLNIGVFLFPIFVGTVLQSMFYGLSLAWLASAMGLCGLFMMQQNELAYVDSLVDVYNRQYFNRVLAAWASREGGVIGAMFDLDDFKSINDTYGHSEGDHALQYATNILKHARQDDEWVFRYAGDEFVVLKRTGDPNGLDAYLHRVHGGLDEFNARNYPYKLSLSYGVSVLDGQSADAFMGDMDKKMYEMKARHHQALGHQGVTP